MNLQIRQMGYIWLSLNTGVQQAIICSESHFDLALLFVSLSAVTSEKGLHERFFSSLRSQFLFSLLSLSTYPNKKCLYSIDAYHRSSPKFYPQLPLASSYAYTFKLSCEFCIIIYPDVCLFTLLWLVSRVRPYCKQDCDNENLILRVLNHKKKKILLQP